MIEINIRVENKTLVRNGLDLQNKKLLVALFEHDAPLFSKHMKLKNNGENVQYQLLKTSSSYEEEVAMNIVWKKRVFVKYVEIQADRLITRDYRDNRPKVWEKGVFELRENTFSQSLKTAVEVLGNPEYVLVIDSLNTIYKLYDSRNAAVPTTDTVK